MGNSESSRGMSVAETQDALHEAQVELRDAGAPIMPRGPSPLEKQGGLFGEVATSILQIEED